MRTESVDVVVVGAGPAGLAAAREISRRGAKVVVLEREQQPGGVPRHCLHTGFGVRDLHRLQSGPAYAARMVDRAVGAGVDLRPGWTVTGWESRNGLVATSSSGRTHLVAGAVVLATGCRERPRPARLVPGSRPAGIFTTGALQQLVHLRGGRAGEVAVVVGTEHVAFSAVQTLASSGTRVAAVVTESPLLETYEALRLATASVRRVPVLTSTRVAAIEGRPTVSGVRLADVDTGAEHTVACDAVVFTGDWVPDFELARARGLEMDRRTRGPLVDGRGRTSAPGIFSAGNVIHPAEPADVVALGGAHIATAVCDWLARRAGFDESAAQVLVEDPLDWVAPQRLCPGEPPARGRLMLRASRVAGAGHVIVRQGGVELHRERVRRLVPHRSLTISADWVARLTPEAGPVELHYVI